MGTPATRILIVDDHAVLRAALRAVLEREPGLVVRGEASSAEGALAALARSPADVVLMDLDMPGMGGLAGTAAVRRAHPATRVVVLSLHADADDARRAHAAGASAYVVKTAADEDLVEALREPGPAPAPPPGDGAPGGLPPLDGTDRDLLCMLAGGATRGEIGARLGLAPQAVEERRARLSDRLGVRGRAGLALAARRAGLVPRPADAAAVGPPR
ncbi:MAG: response regulator transcription factor [Thermoleophilia bacterium]|nr:response regulator transcription factor [Thermoleophilia bacterium]